MAQTENDATWFDAITWVDVCREEVTWVDVCKDGGNNNDCSLTLHSSAENISLDPPPRTDVGTSKSLPRDKSNGNEPENDVASWYELQLGLLQVFTNDIIFDILSRLPIEDLMRCRVVCKSLNRLTKEPHFIDLQVSKALCQPHSFLLNDTMFDSGNNLFLVDSRNGNWKCKEISVKSFQGRHMHLSNSCNGLLCISRINGEDPIICNPITNDCINLPKSDFRSRQTFPCMMIGIAFGFDSTNKKYKLVRVYNMYHDIEGRKFQTKGEIITLGESSWRALNFPYKVRDGDNINSVFLNGAFSWAIHRENDCSHLNCILLLDIINEKFQTIQFPSPIELPEDLDILNFGETIALVKHSGFNTDLLQIWQIVGNRANGARLYQFSFATSAINTHLKKGLTLLGMLSNGDFLYKALETSDVGHSFRAFRYHLVRYSPEKKKGFIVELPGIPRCFKSVAFAPSLASPSNLP